MSNININSENFKKFAKRLQKNSNANMSLMEAQELLARTFGASNLHNLLQMLDNQEKALIEKELKINVGNIYIPSLHSNVNSGNKDSILMFNHKNLCTHSIILGNEKQRTKLTNHILNQYDKNNVQILNSDTKSKDIEILMQNLLQLIENSTSIRDNKLIILNNCLLDRNVSLLCAQIRSMNIGLLFSYTDSDSLKNKANSLDIYDSIISNTSNHFVFDDTEYEYNKTQSYRLILDDLKYRIYTNVMPSKINIEF
jgi:hypothetical protein